MRMRREGWVVVVLLAAMSAGMACAATVRGRLQKGNNGVSGIAVSLVGGPNNVTTTRVYSDGNGMYYVPNVKPGTYTLQIWASSNGKPFTFTNIKVVEPVTNVNPVKIP